MKLDILTEAIERCLDEMYRYSQPSITFKELEELSKKEAKEKGEPQPVYERFYLSSKEYETIINKYLEAYNLNDPFKYHCDLIIDDMKNGCSKDKWIEGKDGFPGHRGYEKVPPLSEEIGEDNLKKVTDFIKMRRDFYKTDRNASKFRFTVMNYSPCSNKQTVIDYWKSQGKDIEIEDRNEDDMFDVHYYGTFWDEWNDNHE